MRAEAPSQETKLTRLRAAFDDQRCVSAWLGYGDVLFLGLGSDVLPRPQAGERHPAPPFELETNYAAWRIDGDISAECSDSESSSDTAKLTTAAESLVGETVLAWQLLEGSTLRLVFTGEKVLIVEPWQPRDAISDAWSISAPDGKVLAVSNDGRVVVVDADVPVADWFV